MLKHYNLSIVTDPLKLLSFKTDKIDNFKDVMERDIIIKTVIEKLQFKNLRRNAFNFSYVDTTFSTDLETITTLPKCIAHLNVLIDESKQVYDLFVVFRSLHYDKNFNYDMTTIEKLIVAINEKYKLLCREINLVFNNIHTEQDINLKDEINKRL